MYPLEVRFQTGFRRARLAQAVPAVNPVLPTMPSAPTSGPLAAGILGGIFVLALGTVGTLFNYGIARESRSKMVKTTGYIVAGVSALSTLVAAGAMVLGANK